MSKLVKILIILLIRSKLSSFQRGKNSKLRLSCQNLSKLGFFSCENCSIFAVFLLFFFTKLFRFLGHGWTREVPFAAPIVLPPGPLCHIDFRRRAQNHLQESQQMVRRTEAISSRDSLSRGSQQDRW